MKIPRTQRNAALAEHIDSMPLALAPDRVQQVAVFVSKAQLVFNSAESISMLAPNKIRTAERAWDIVAERSVRAGEGLPPKDLIELATVKKGIADADLRKVTGILAEAVNDAGAVLADDHIRDEWQAACEKRATEIQQALRTSLATISPLLAELSQMLGTSQYLQNFGEQLSPAGGLRGDPITPLSDAINARPWRPAVIVTAPPTAPARVLPVHTR